MAEHAEYGDDCPSAIVPSGKNISSLNPADASHAASAGTSPQSPIPQLRVDVAENRGSRTPRRRIVEGIVVGYARNTRARPSAKIAGSGSRLSTRNASFGKSKK